MNPKLLAKLTARGVSFDGTRGRPELTAMDVAASLSACEPRSYMALMAKWLGDESAQRGLQRAIQRATIRQIVEKELKHTDGYKEGARLCAKLVYLQFIDGYRCHHCGGSGEVDNKKCKNCDGSSLGCYSEEFRAIYMGVSTREYRNRGWRELVDTMETEVNGWESAGWAALEAAIG